MRRALWWSVTEIGLAGIADSFGSSIAIVQRPPIVSPPTAAVACPVVLAELCERNERHQESAGITLMRSVTPGSAVLIEAATQDTTAFGSTTALEAAASGALAIMTDGAMRDASLIAKLPIVAASRGRNALSPAAQGHVQVRRSKAHVFGLDWEEGDWVILDSDALARLPASNAEQVASALVDAHRELAELIGGEAD
jgi:regulator of RNase E activity RraA